MKTFGFPLLVLGTVLALAPAIAQGETAFTLTTHTAGSDFYFENAAGTKNPTLNVPASTEVSITVRNADNGFHNLHVLAPVDQKSADVSTEGDEQTITFTTPASGTIKYQCDYHLTTMFGNIVVGGGSTPTTTTTENGGEKNGAPGLQVAGVAIAVLGAALLLRRK